MTIPFDPDFDAPASIIQSSSSTTTTDIINGLTGRTAFVAGIVTSVLLLGTLGFFVMLVYLVRG